MNPPTAISTPPMLMAMSLDTPHTARHALYFPVFEFRAGD
jgi:hypothetical protein